MLSILNSVNTLLCLSRQQPSNADTRIVTSQNEEGGRSSTQFEGGQVTLRIMQNWGVVFKYAVIQRKAVHIE